MEKTFLLYLSVHWRDLIEQIKKICHIHFKYLKLETVALPLSYLVSVTLYVMRSKHRADLVLSVFDGAPLHKKKEKKQSFRRFYCIFLFFPCTLFTPRSG